MTPAAARQRVSRRTGSVRSLDKLAFPRNARFLYLPEQYGSPAFWTGLVNALHASNGSYARALLALKARGGIMPKAHFGIAIGAPLKQMRQLNGEEVLARLIEARLLEELEEPGVGTCIAFAKDFAYLEQPAAAMKARLITEAVLLGALKSWARNLGLGSFDKFNVRDEGLQQPRVATFEWDIAAPSYLGPLATWGQDGKPKPGFTVFDTLLSGTLNEDDLSPFVHKCVTLRKLKNVGRCIQFFVAQRYAPDALKLLRKHGVVAATPAMLFGDDVAAALMELTATLTSAAEAAVDPEKFAELFSKLSKFEGAAGTLRGALFEFTVAEIVRKVFHAQVKMNVIYRENGKDAAEVDVRGVVEGQRVYFIECKGHLPGRPVDDEEVERWLTKRVPFVRRKALEHPDWKGMELHFEFWTTGELSDASKAMIARAKQSIRPSTYKIEARLAKDVERLAQETADASVIKVLQQHFLEHPAAQIDQALGSVSSLRVTEGTTALLGGKLLVPSRLIT